MSDFVKMEEGKCYYVTFTVVGWLDVFTRSDYSGILVNSIKYYQRNKDLEIYGYCIMPNHVHMIASNPSKLSAVLRDLKNIE